MNYNLQLLLLMLTTSYHFISSIKEKKSLPAPGKIFEINGARLHLYSKGKGNPTIVIDHSLGGIDGYFLIEEISKLTKVCIYDRAGYGWSHPSVKPRTSQEIVNQLDKLLFDRITLQRVKKSFYSHNHWITMAREIWNLDKSARYLIFICR
jgi:pimeloyl-ACP methyl ester carboxylesterase